ncbi:MAG: zinc-ribbon domain-containing protein [Planctomycetes bacterium]|nr:zinc-ribbon domain-containing protein [Planctomycetota bacterium]
MPTVACPNCQMPLSVPESAAGRKVRCPQCQTVFTAGATGPAGGSSAGERPGGTRRARRGVRRPADSSGGLWLLGGIALVALLAGGFYLATSGPKDESAAVRRLREDPTLKAFISSGGESGRSEVRLLERHDQEMTESRYALPVGSPVKVNASVRVNGQMYLLVESTTGVSDGWTPERFVELRK